MNLRLLRENARDRVGEDHKQKPDRRLNDRVVERGGPNRFLGAVGPVCAEVLADECRRRIRKPDRRQQCEDHDANADLITGDGDRAKAGHDAHQPDPARGLDKELKDRRRRHLYQAPKAGWVQPPMTAPD